ncbi:MAG: NYN domain-containing protein [Proteobacteria bacterium]|nr:NYN domain-containing protein [Pseudomonadota bacterium]
MRTYVYVDGFNLYYGSVKGTPCRWLNIQSLCQALLPKHDIDKIKYFTARVSARPGDPGQPTRQQMYLRALRTIPNLEIIYGHFLSNEAWMQMVVPNPAGQLHANRSPIFSRVIRTEEKGSDVNIASHLLFDAFNDRFETAVVVSNDSDLVMPISMVREKLLKKVGILNPRPKTPSRALQAKVDFFKPIRFGAVQASQFPDELEDAKGTFRKPREW